MRGASLWQPLELLLETFLQPKEKAFLARPETGTLQIPNAACEQGAFVCALLSTSAGFFPQVYWFIWPVSYNPPPGKIIQTTPAHGGWQEAAAGRAHGS